MHKWMFRLRTWWMSPAVCAMCVSGKENKLNSQWVIIASHSLSGSPWGWIFAGPVPADLGRSPEPSHMLLICVSVYWVEWECRTGNSERGDSFLVNAQERKQDSDTLVKLFFGVGLIFERHPYSTLVSLQLWHFMIILLLIIKQQEIVQDIIHD